jgi:hypothetical protein
MGNGRSRGGLYAAMAVIAMTVGLGVVGAAGADQPANKDVYARENGAIFCFSTDPASTCPSGEAGDVTIDPNDSVTWHFDGAPSDHNVADAGTPPAWQSTYPTIGTYARSYPDPGTYDFICQAHPQMKGRVTVGDGVGTPTPSPSPSPSPTPSTQPSGPTTPPPTGGSDSVKPTVKSVRPTALRRGVRVRFTLSEPATVTLRVKRGRKVLKSARIQAAAGTRSVTLRSRRLKKGRYTVEVVARDTAGNRSLLATKRVTLRR